MENGDGSSGALRQRLVMHCWGPWGCVLCREYIVVLVSYQLVVRS